MLITDRMPVQRAMQEGALVELQLVAKHGGTVSYFFLLAALILLDSHTINCQNGRHHAVKHARSPDVGQ